MAAAEFSVKVSGVAAAERSALKWPPSPAASSRVVQNGGRRRNRAERPYFSVSSALGAPGNSWLLLSFAVSDGVEEKLQLDYASCRVLAGCADVGQAGRGTVCLGGGRAWRGRGRAPWREGDGPREGPSRWRGTSDAQESRSPASRRGEVKRGLSAGCPSWGEAEGEGLGPFVGPRRQWRGGCQSRGIYGWEGAYPEAAGGPEAAFLPREQRAGR